MEPSILTGQLLMAKQLSLMPSSAAKEMHIRKAWKVIGASGTSWPDPGLHEQ